MKESSFQRSFVKENFRFWYCITTLKFHGRQSGTDVREAARVKMERSFIARSFNLCLSETLREGQASIRKVSKESSFLTTLSLSLFDPNFAFLLFIPFFPLIMFIDLYFLFLYSFICNLISVLSFSSLFLYSLGKTPSGSVCFFATAEVAEWGRSKVRRQE